MSNQNKIAALRVLNLYQEGKRACQRNATRMSLRLVLGKKKKGVDKKESPKLESEERMEQKAEPLKSMCVLV